MAKLSKLLKYYTPNQGILLREALALPIALNKEGARIELKPDTPFLRQRILTTLLALKADVVEVCTFSASDQAQMDELAILLPDHSDRVPAVADLISALEGRLNVRRSRSGPGMTASEILEQVRNEPLPTKKELLKRTREDRVSETVADILIMLDHAVPLEEDTFIEIVDFAMTRIIGRIAIQVLHDENFKASSDALNIYADALMVGIDENGVILVVTA